MTITLKSEQAIDRAAELLLIAFPWLSKESDIGLGPPDKAFLGLSIRLTPDVSIDIEADDRKLDLSHVVDGMGKIRLETDLSEEGVLGAVSAFAERIMEFPWATEKLFKTFRTAIPMHIAVLNKDLLSGDRFTTSPNNTAIMVENHEWMSLSKQTINNLKNLLFIKEILPMTDLNFCTFKPKARV